MVTISINAIGNRNILLFLPALPSHAHTASKPSAASSWFAAPEERPHELVAGKTKANAEHHRDDRCDPRVRDGFAPTRKLRDVFAVWGEKLLEHIASEAGRRVERGQAEH